MDVVIISWQGFLDRSIVIANECAKAGGRVHIVHSQESALASGEQGNFTLWQVSNEDFFGRKFLKALDIVGEKPFLLVQADARCDDWAGLLDRFRGALGARPIGVWAPAIHHTSWVNRKVLIRDLGDDNLLQVSQTDAIVIGFSEAVAKRLRNLNFSENNLGWGIDWAAIVFSISSGQLVVRDPSIQVKHKAGSGYRQAEAKRQQDVFLDQLTDSEKAVLVLLRRSHRLSRRSIQFALQLNQFVDDVLSRLVALIKQLFPSKGKFPRL